MLIIRIIGLFRKFAKPPFSRECLGHHRKGTPGIGNCYYVLIKIHQRGVQWKQGLVIYMMLHASLLDNTTPIHCTPLPLHPPVRNTQALPEGVRDMYMADSPDQPQLKTQKCHLLC